MEENEIAQELTVSLDESNNDNTINSILDGISPLKGSLENIDASTSSIAEDVGTKGWFYETLHALKTYSEPDQAKESEEVAYKDSVAESLNSLKLLNETNDKEAKLDKKKKGKVGKNTKQDDLSDISSDLGTGFSALINAVTDTAKNDGKGATGFFKGLMEGAAGIATLAVALFVFAGATMIFNFTDWGSAVIGMLAFTAFTIEMIVLAKIVGKNAKDFALFAIGSLTMATALGVFSISLAIASAVFSGNPIDILGIKLPKIDLQGALIGVGAFAVFELAMLGLAYALNKATGDLAKFGIGSMTMSLALGFFSISLAIVSAVMQAKEFDLGFIKLPAIDALKALEGIGLFLVFETGLAIVSRLVAKEIPDFKKFAKGSIFMSGALIAFSLSLVLVSSILSGKELDLGFVKLPAVDIVAAAAGTGLFIAFIISIAVVGKLAGGQIGTMIKFSLVSMLMTVALALFSTAVWITGAVLMPGKHKYAGFEIEGVDFAFVMLGLASFVIFLLAFTGIGAACTVVLPFIALTSLAAVLVGGAVFLMSQALVLASLVGNPKGGKAKIMGLEYVVGPHSQSDLDGAFSMFGSMIHKFKALAKDVGLFGLPAILLVSSALIPLAISLGMMADVLCKAMMMKIEVEKKGGKWDTHVLDGSFDMVIYTIQKLSAVAKEIGIRGAIALRIITSSINPIIKGIGNMSDILVKAMLMRIEVENAGGEWNTKVLDGGFDMVIHTIEALGAVADDIGTRGAVAVRILASSIKPIIQGIDYMSDVLVEAMLMKVDVESKGGEWNTKVLDGGFDMVLQVLWNLAAISEEIGRWGAGTVLKLTKSLDPIIDAIDRMSDVLVEAMLMKIKVENKGGEWNTKVLDGGFNMVLQVLWNLAAISEEVGRWGAGTILKLTKSFDPIINAIDRMADVLVKAMLMKVKVESKGGQWNTKVLDGSFDLVIHVINCLAEVADEMGLFHARKFKIVTDAVIPIALAIDLITDAIIKAASIGEDFDVHVLDGTFEVITSALHSLEVIAGEMSTKSAWLLPIISDACVPIAQSLNLMADAIIKTASIKDIVKEEGGIEFSQQILDDSMGIVVQCVEKLADVSGKVSEDGAVAVANLAQATGPIANTLDKMVDIVKKAYDAREAMKNINSSVFIDLLDPVVSVISALSGEAEKVVSVKKVGWGIFKHDKEIDRTDAVKALTEQFKVVSGVLSEIIDAIVKVVDLGAGKKDFNKLMDAAINGMEYIIFGDGQNSKGVYGVLQKLGGTDLKFKDAAIANINSLKTAMTGLNGILEPLGELKDSVSGKKDVFIECLLSVTDLIENGLNKFMVSISNTLSRADAIDDDTLKKVESIKNIFSKFKDISVILSEIKFDILSKVDSLPTFENFIKTMENFKEGCSSLQSGLKLIEVNGKENDMFATLANSLERISKVNIEKQLTQLEVFAGKKEDFLETAEALEQVVSALERIHKSSLVEKMDEASGVVAGRAKKVLDNFESISKMVGESNAGSTVVIEEGQELQGIANIMANWYNNGVCVFSKKEKPVRTRMYSA